MWLSGRRRVSQRRRRVAPLQANFFLPEVSTLLWIDSFCEQGKLLGVARKWDKGQTRVLLFLITLRVGGKSL